MDENLKILVKDKINDINNKTVLIIGIGGVGGYALEAIARSFVGNIIIADNDYVTLSNLNRQIISLHSNIGKLKVDVAMKRIKDINPECNVVTINDFISADNLDLLFNYKIDYIIDACDTVPTKVLVIKECLKREIKFVSCMGTGNKFDPLKLKIMDIRKTSYDPIAKKIRKVINDEGIKGNIPVVCSEEVPVKSDKLGTNAYVPATAGMLLASYVINDMIGG